MKEIERLRCAVGNLLCFFTIAFFVITPIGLYKLIVNTTLGLALIILSGFFIVSIMAFSDYHSFLQEEINLITDEESDTVRCAAVKMKFSSFLNIYQSVPNQCVLNHDSVYFFAHNTKRKVSSIYVDDRLYVYFSFWGYLKYSQYIKRIEQKAAQKEEEKDLEKCLDIIESLKAEVKKSKNKADDEMIDAYNNFVQKARAYTNAADIDDWGLFKGLTLEIKQNYER